MKARVLAAKLLLLFGTVVSCLAIAEAALRIAGYAPPQPHQTPIGDMVEKPAPYIPYLFRPGATFTETWPSDPHGYFGPGNSVTYRMNAAGFRGADFTREHGDAVRIAFLGDSFCFGNGVRFEDHFVTLLERTSTERNIFGRPVEVYDFGLPNYNTINEVALFEHTVLGYAPDVCVLWYFLNDTVLVAGQDGLGTKQYFGRRKLLVTWRDRLRVLDAMLTPIEARLAQREMIASYQRNHEPDSESMKYVGAALEVFARECREHGIAPVLAIHPVLIALDGDHPFRAAHENVRAAAERHGITVIDLLPEFVARYHGDPRDLWVHPIDPHPNFRAHAIAAAAMTERLEGLVRDGVIDVGRRSR